MGAERSRGRDRGGVVTVGELFWTALLMKMVRGFSNTGAEDSGTLREDSFRLLRMNAAQPRNQAKRWVLHLPSALSAV
jgi:hypothetical protein